MIPYSVTGTNETRRTFPLVNLGLIAANVVVFLHELQLGAQSNALLNVFILRYALTPCEYTSHCAVPVGSPSPFWLTLVTSMFLHAGWLHLLGNMLFLYLFGGHVENAMGHLRYLVFYLLAGLAANGLEIATAASSHIQGLGASGAIAGVLAAYLLLYPRSRVRTLVPVVEFLFPISLPAWVMIGLWFLLQLFSGVATLDATAAGDTGGVAYWAHVGGFAAGLILVWFFRRPDRVRCWKV